MPPWIYVLSVSALPFRPILCSGAGAHRKARGARKAAVAAECEFSPTVNAEFCLA
jgi:hypothetical protein